jgi:hypothetical protein
LTDSGTATIVPSRSSDPHALTCVTLSPTLRRRVKVADDGSVKVDVVKVADDAWHEARPLGTTAWHVRSAINFDIARKLVLHATKPSCGFIESSQRLCAQRLLTAETQVTLTLSQPSPTAKSLTPHRTRHTSGHVSALRTHEHCQRQACGARTPEQTTSRRASRFHTPCVSHSHDSRSPPPAPLDISYHTPSPTRACKVLGPNACSTLEDAAHKVAKPRPWVGQSCLG